MALEDALRAVIEAARSYRPKMSGLGNLFDAEGTELMRAVDELNRLTQARIESVELDRPWREVFEGNEVLAPNGSWYRITSIPPWHENDGRIRVGMEINGKEGFFPREPDAMVRVRVTLPDPMETALANLRAEFGDVTIIGTEES